MIRNRSDANTLQRHFQGGIQQIWLPELGVVDRCTSCHVGLKEASLTDVPMQPFRTHPVIPHKLEQFGCTVCHRGQGAATTVEEAHNSTLAWEQPILPAKYIESSCGQCHRGPLPGTPQLNQGRNLLSRDGCVHCHTVKLPDGSTMKATDDPPSLSHIADKTTREWIYRLAERSAGLRRYGDHAEFQAERRRCARHLRIPDRQQHAARGRHASRSRRRHPSDPAAGASLYGESFCASCHAVQNAAGNMVGGDVGPELTRVGSKVKPEWLQAWLRNPRDYDPGTGMPHYRFNDPQVATLSGFLLAKADSDLLANVHLDAATPEQIAHGKRLVSDYGCASCHEIAGIKKPENFAPELSRIGSKPVTQLVFLPGMQHTLPDYIATKIKQPRAFGQGLKMPQYTFTPAQIDALTTALLALNDRSNTLPPSLAVAATPESDYQPAGKAGKLMTDLACFSCHRINGHGGDMAPDLTWEGSSVQREWLVQFFKNPGHAASFADSPHAAVQPDRRRGQRTHRLHHDRLPESGGRSRLDAAERLLARPGRTRQAALLRQVFLPGLPHRRHQDRQRIHRPDSDAGRFAPDRGVDLSVDEESAGSAPGHGRTEPRHERRRCPRAHCIPDVAKRRSQTGGRQEMTRYCYVPNSCGDSRPRLSKL